jgi:hypothetical protein
MVGRGALEEVLAQFADTPAEHQAVADYYKGEAAKARAAAEQDELAKQYDELAAAHLALAK